MQCSENIGNAVQDGGGGQGGEEDDGGDQVHARVELGRVAGNA